MDRLRQEAEVCQDDEEYSKLVAQYNYWVDLCSQIAEAAMKAPQLLKWTVTGPAGEPFEEWTTYLLSQARGLSDPGWWAKSRAAEASVWNVYELADEEWLIEDPITLQDHNWNRGIRTIQKWCAEHPQEDLDLVDLAEYALELRPELAERMAKHGKSKYLFRKVRSMWFGYWAQNYGLDDVDHEGFYAALETRCKELGIEGVLRVWLWEPSEDAKTDGFGFKWTVTGLSGVELVSILGFHPDVLAALVVDSVAQEVRREAMVSVLCGRRSGA
jgi:hypothetical protein